ncbi:MAG: ATP-binding protein [Pseudomonadota bacterium]
MLPGFPAARGLGRARALAGAIALLALLALTSHAQSLRERIDQTLNGQLTVAERIAVLDEVFQGLEATAESDPQLLGHAYVARGYVFLQAGRLEEGIAVLNEGMARVPAAQAPNEHVNLRSMRAASLLAAGRTEQSVDEYESILANLPETVDPSIELRARANYASALFESGRILAASEVLRESIPNAESLGNDRMALGLANNLLVILIQRGLHEDAQEWLERLTPLRQRANDLSLLNSLRLHELELQRIFGDAQGAADGLREFVASDTPGNASVIGNAYEYLGDAERELGHLVAAEAAGRRAIELLEKVPWELPEAHISLARTLLAKEQPAQAEAVLDAISTTAQLSPARTSTIASLRLEAQLRQAGLDRSTAQLQQLLQAVEDDRQVDSLDYTRYYDARLEAQRQQSQIARMREAEALLAAEAEAAEARARELETRQAALRDHRNMVLALMLLGCAAVLATLYSLNRRQYQRKLLEGEQERNRQLSVAVEEQAVQLKRQLSEQADMEHALHEKKHTEQIGQIAGNVAHDFNNLLQVISSANETLDQQFTEPAARDMLRASNQSVAYARAMTRQLLAYARQQELVPRPVDVVGLLRDSRTLFRSAVGEEVTIEYELPDTAVAMLDASKLTSAVLNLLTNAADAMPAGGTVRVTVSEPAWGAQCAEEWPSLAPGDYVVIRVSDTGTGMDATTQDQACEPFYSTKAEHAGTGLGLSSVYGFVRQTGGDLRIVSAPTRGTTVSLAVPAAASAPPVPLAHEARAEPTPASAGERVLVVEDNDLVAGSLCAILESMVAEVQHVSSADEAIAHLSAGNDYDFVLSDVRMPGEHDGYDLARWLEEHRPSMATILMSGFNDHLDEDSPYRMINKPFSRAELREAMRSAEPLTSS